MRRPPRPPLVPWESLDNESLLAAFQQAEVLQAAKVRHLPWAEVRRRAAPGTAEAVWTLVRRDRGAYAVDLPLATASGALLTVNPSAPAVLPDLLEVEAAARDPLGMVDPRDASAAGGELLAATLVEESLESSILEGAATTRPAARRLLRTGRSPRTHGEQMVLDNYRTMRSLEDLCDRSLTPELICEMHRSMTEGTLDDPRDAGRIQSPDEERVGVYAIGDDTLLHASPPAEELPARLRALCDFANAEDPGVPKVLRAILLHLQLAWDHPFVDGNGRTARALFYWALLRDRYWVFRYLTISKFIAKQRQAYSRAFVHSHDDADATYFVLHQLGVIRLALEDMRRQVARRRDRLREARGALESWPELNPRQRTVVGEALKDRTLDFRTRAHKDRFRVTGQTALTDLRHLVDLGLFELEREGRGFVFSPAPDLPARLQRGERAGSR